MKTPKMIFVALAILLFGFQFFLLENKSNKKEIKITKKISEKVEKAKDNYGIILDELNQLQKIAPYSTSIVKYGISAEGRDCVYFRLGTQDKPKILIHGGLNGEEKQTVAVSIQLLNNLLKNQSDNEIKWLIENREIYFIPVVSPDAFAENKNNPSKFPNGAKYDSMTASVKNLVDLANDLKFKAVLNLHSDGKSIAKPTNLCAKDYNNVSNLVEKMSNLSGLKIDKNIVSEDANWFYTTGSCSVVMNIDNKNLPQAYDAVVTFMKEAAESDMNPQPIRPIFYQAD